MLDHANIPAVTPDEILARFILFSRHIRASEKTVKPDAFMPHPHIELSLTRHTQATPEELWQEGTRVATQRTKTLYGRADVEVLRFHDQELQVVAAPIPENPNHVNATGWPQEKSIQKLKALKIAESARFLDNPIPPAETSGS